jgi:hypothetical protein
MGWNKNTLNISEVEKTIELLKELNINYILTDIGEVQGYGLNDYSKKDKHKIRRLEYKDKIILEKIIRTEECDLDDIIVSEKFDKNKVPKKWKIEVKSKNE